jgi:lipopolysaccharide/colanic/teichoic acid biosynthesis glycosyltransferase
MEKPQPGIISLGQIRYKYADNFNLEQMLKIAKCDLIYSDNLYLWTDIKIILNAVKVIMEGKGRRNIKNLPFTPIKH